MKIRSAVPENVCVIFDGRKKSKKTPVKHIRYRLIGGCVKITKCPCVPWTDGRLDLYRRARVVRRRLDTHMGSRSVTCQASR